MTTWIDAPAAHYRLALSSEDEEWGMRAALAEGGIDPLAPADALWCWAQRMVALFERGTPMASFAQLVRAHSQPVNPIWRRDGPMCAPGGRYEGTDSCELTRLDKRDFWQHAPYGAALSARPARLAVAQAWFDGTIYNDVPRAVNFADQKVALSYLSKHPDAWLVKGSPKNNYFLGEWHVGRWDDDHVRVMSDRTGTLLVASASTGPARPGAALALTQGFLRWWRAT